MFARSLSVPDFDKKLYFYEDELLAWIENGRRKTAKQTYEEMLANMQNDVRHKPKSSMQF